MTVGGVAVAVLTVLAAWTRGLFTPGERPGRTFMHLLTATGWVLAAKAIASPHAPPMAFVAVAFQGALAAVVFSVVRPFRAAAVIFAVLAMLESAGQKFLVLTLLFGASWWEAATALLASAAGAFGLTGEAVGFGLLGGYLGAYAVWGAVLGWAVSGAPRRYAATRADLLAAWEAAAAAPAPLPASSARRSPWRAALATALGLALSLATLALTGTDTPELLRIVLRTVAVSVLLFAVVGPLIRYAAQRWSRSARASGPALFLVGSLEETARRWAFCRTYAAGRSRFKPLALFLAVDTLIHLSLLSNSNSN